MAGDSPADRRFTPAKHKAGWKKPTTAAPTKAATKWATQRSQFVPGKTITDAVPAPQKRPQSLLGGVGENARKGLGRVERNLERVDDAQSKVTGVHAKTVAKTYADPFRTDFWPQLGGSGKSLLSPKQQAEQAAFADSVMMFHGIGAGGGLARRPVGTRNPLGVAASHGLNQVAPAAQRLATEQTGSLLAIPRISQDALAGVAARSYRNYKVAHPQGELTPYEAISITQKLHDNAVAGGKRTIDDILFSGPSGVAHGPAEREFAEQTVAALSRKYWGHRLVDETGTLGLPKLRGRRAEKAADEPLPDGDVPAPTPEEKLRQGMKGAKRGYAKQKVARSAELSTRAKKASAAYRDIPDPFEAHYAAKAALKGELPKNQLNAVPSMTHEELEQLMTTVKNHESLLPFQKVKTTDALTKVFAGGQPAPHEIRLIEHVFGVDKAREIAASTGGTWGDKLINAVNIPRSLQSTLDISGLTRQAFVAMTTHPIIWGKASPSYVKAFRTKNYKLIDEAVKNDPLYPLALGHVSFSGIGDSASLLSHEEAFASEYATKIPGIGKAVKGSAQGYVGFLNKIRMDMFAHFVRLEVKAGKDPHREEFLKSVGDIVNAATGRGAIHGRLEHMMPAANTLLYSPRLMLSRLNYFDPSWYFRLKGRRARIEALKGLFATTAYVTSIVTLLSQIPGVDVGSTSPLSSDFGKLRIGDTRVDMAAGFLQYVHLAAMLKENAKISSTTGNKIEFGTGFGEQTRWDQIENFFVNKAAPPVSFTIGMARGHDPVGNPVSLSSPGAAADAAGNLFIPLALQDAKALYQQKQGGLDGITAAVAGYGASGIGLGLQTYAAKPASKSSKDKWGKSGSSSSSASDKSKWSKP